MSLILKNRHKKDKPKENVKSVLVVGKGNEQAPSNSDLDIPDEVMEEQVINNITRSQRPVSSSSEGALFEPLVQPSSERLFENETMTKEQAKKMKDILETQTNDTSLVVASGSDGDEVIIEHLFKKNLQDEPDKIKGTINLLNDATRLDADLALDIFTLVEDLAVESTDQFEDFRGVGDQIREDERRKKYTPCIQQLLGNYPDLQKYMTPELKLSFLQFEDFMTIRKKNTIKKQLNPSCLREGNGEAKIEKPDPVEEKKIEEKRTEHFDISTIPDKDKKLF
jgi:hypothetical protein